MGSIYDNDRLRQDVEGDFITLGVGQEVHGLVLDVVLKTFGDSVNPQYTLRVPDGREMKLTAGARDLKRQCFELRPERGDWLRVKCIRQEGGKGDQNGAKLFEVEVRHAAQQAPPAQPNGWGQQPYQPQQSPGYQGVPAGFAPASAPPAPGQWGQQPYQPPQGQPAPTPQYALPYPPQGQPAQPQQQAAPPQSPAPAMPQPTQPVGQTQVPGMPPAAPVMSRYAGVDAMSPEQRAAMAAAGLDQPPF